MYLSDLHSNHDIANLLTGGATGGALSQPSHGHVANGVIDEAFLSGMAKAALIKAKAATMLPAGLTKNAEVSKLLRIAHGSQQPITSRTMAAWWQALGRAVRTVYPDFTNSDIKRANTHVIAKWDSMVADAKLSFDDDRVATARKTELKDTESDLSHKHDMRSMRAKYGAEDDERRLRRAKTIAKLLGLDDTDIDPDVIMDIMKGGDNSGLARRIKSRLSKVLRGKSARKAKTAEKVAAEEFVRLTYHNIIGEDWAEIAKKAGTGLLGAFSSSGRNEMTKRALATALRHYIAAYAIKSAFEAAKQRAAAGAMSDIGRPKPSGGPSRSRPDTTRYGRILP